MKLNLGCGDDWRKDALNIDFRRLEIAQGCRFLRADVTKLDKHFPPASVTEIWALDILEHVPRPLVKSTLETWVRLLVTKGVIHIRVPDLTLLAEKIIDPKVPDDHAAWLIYGGQANAGAFHKSGFTEKMLRKLLMEVGVKIIELKRYQQETNIYIKAVK